MKCEKHCNLWRSVNRNFSTRKSSRPGAARNGAELILASALVVAASHRALGSTASWIGTTSANFSTNANWSLAGGVNGVTGANLQFGATGNANPVNDLTSQTWPTLTFLSGAQAFTLTGNGFTLNSSSASGIVNNSTSLQTIDLLLTLSGGGRAIDAAAGPISIEDGIAGTSGAFYGDNPSLTGGSSSLFSTVTLNSAAAYSTASTGTAATAVESGTLQIGTGGSLPTSITNATGWVALGNSTSNTSGVLELGDATTAINQTINKLTAFGSGTANAVVGGNSSASTLTINYVVTTSTDSYTGALGGSGANQNNLAVIKLGAGTVQLSGTNNSYTGTTTVNGGTLINNGDITARRGNRQPRRSFGGQLYQ